MDLIEYFVDYFDGRCNSYNSEQTFWYGFIMLKNNKNFSIVYEKAYIAYEHFSKASIMLKSIHK
ncbi:MAG TPA: hypothetical protein VK250_10705 [Nitrososphaeraceae archaeon]|nr:hypothetical protein [Nitrososphaeraceae archaeon]